MARPLAGDHPLLVDHPSAADHPSAVVPSVARHPVAIHPLAAFPSACHPASSAAFRRVLGCAALVVLPVVLRLPVVVLPAAAALVRQDFRQAVDHAVGQS